MKYILGLLDNESEKYYNIDNKHSTHMGTREGRAKLVHPKANPLYYFEVFRPKDRSRQIHCLLEDATIIVFNKKDKKIITFIIADECLIDEYIEHTFSTRNEETISNLYKCAKLNRKTKANKISENINDNFDFETYINKKQKILKKC